MIAENRIRMFHLTIPFPGDILRLENNEED